MLTSISESLTAVEALHQNAVEDFAKERSDAKQIEIDMLTGSNLNIQVERHRALFNTVLDQLKQAQFVSDVTSITSMAVEPPYALRKPTSPKIVSLLAAAFLLGTILGIGAGVHRRSDGSTDSLGQRSSFDTGNAGARANQPHSARTNWRS